MSVNNSEQTLPHLKFGTSYSLPVYPMAFQWLPNGFPMAFGRFGVVSTVSTGIAKELVVVFSTVPFLHLFQPQHM
jgi:hypothetical protein